MDWLKSIFEKSEWRLVAERHAPYGCWSVDEDGKKFGDPDEYVMTYYLYEDQKGNRKFDVVDQQRGDLNVRGLRKEDFVFRSHEYRTVIRPWLDGRYDPDILTWDKVPVHDFKAKLTDKKSK